MSCFLSSVAPRALNELWQQAGVRQCFKYRPWMPYCAAKLSVTSKVIDMCTIKHPWSVLACSTAVRFSAG